MPRQPAVIPRPDLREESAVGAGDWLVVVFDNDRNTFDEVIKILQKATGCTLAEAEMETWEVHHLGKSIVHHGEQPECERVAAVIRTIGLRVAVDQL